MDAAKRGRECTPTVAMVTSDYIPTQAGTLSFASTCTYTILKVFRRWCSGSYAH